MTESRWWLPADREKGDGKEFVRSCPRDRLQRSLRKIGVCEKYIHYLDCVDGFTIVCVYQTFQIVHFKHMQIILHQLHISKASKNHSGQFSWPIMHSFNGSILSHHDTPLFVQHFQAIYSFVFCLFG